MTDSHSKAGELLDPILEVFGGTDGGIAFAKLRHGFLPEMILKADSGDYNATAFITMVNQFSRLCSAMQTLKL